MVECELPKLETRVRFPSPALFLRLWTIIAFSMVITAWAQPPEISWKQLSDSAFKEYRKGNYSGSIHYTQQALAAARKEFGEGSLQEAESMGNLSALYRVESKILKEKSSAIRRKNGLDGVPLGIQSEIFFDEVQAARSQLKSDPQTPQQSMAR